MLKIATGSSTVMSAWKLAVANDSVSSLAFTPRFRDGITTDDSEAVATLVNQITDEPHRFAERYLELERRFTTIEAAHKRLADVVQSLTVPGATKL